MSRTDNSVKILRNMPTSNLKPYLHSINAYTKFGENPLTFTRGIVRERKYGRTYDRRADGRAGGRTDRRTHGHQREAKILRYYRVTGYNQVSERN